LIISNGKKSYKLEGRSIVPKVSKRFKGKKKVLKENYQNRSAKNVPKNQNLT